MSEPFIMEKSTDTGDVLQSGAGMNRELLGMGAVLAGCWACLAVAFDAAVAAGVGHNENWLLGIVLFSPVLLIGLVLFVAAARGSRFDARGVAVAVAVITGAIFAATFFSLFAQLASYLLAAVAGCVGVCAFVAWKPRFWPAAVLLLLAPALIAWSLMLYGNLTYKHDMSRSNDVATYRELQADLKGRAAIRFPDLTAYAGVDAFRYTELSRRDAWLDSADSYYLSSGDWDADGLEKLARDVGGASSLAFLEVECRNLGRSYGFGTEAPQVDPSETLFGVGVDVSVSESRLNDGWTHRSHHGYTYGDLYGSIAYEFEIDGYYYRVRGDYGIAEGDSDADAGAKREDAAAEVKALAMSMLESWGGFEVRFNEKMVGFFPVACAVAVLMC